MMMTNHMKHMPSLPTLASALCHIATITVVMRGRTDLGTAPGVAGGSHRHLESTEAPHDPLAMDPLAQTVARLEKAVDTHGARLTAVEEENTEFKAILNDHMEDHGGTGHGGARTPTAGAQLLRNTTGDDIQAQLRSLQRRDDELQTSIRELAQEHQRRGLQGVEPEPEPEIGENVKIIKPQVVRCGGPGGTTSNGIFDSSQCDDRAFASCHADVCAAFGEGHRRAQSDEASCDVNELAWRTDHINTACCDDPGEDCSDGYPHSCNADCAHLFLSFWDECYRVLGKESRQFEPMVEMCEETTSVALTLAEQLNVECSDGTAAAECVPECSETLHGSLMLLNIEGHDSKFACELRHGLYSWVGPAVRFACFHASLLDASPYTD